MINQNPVNQLILKFIEKTNKPIFMTGRAGTGKTTFLQQIKKITDKNFAVVAPTAVAAINAGGVTINSFFQIPFGPLVPIIGSPSIEGLMDRRVSRDKSKIIKCLELLIIDEISMVRADTIDYIDSVLREIKGICRPFGGVQLLMIGDLHQLSPVFQNDWHILKKFYKSPYFFDSLSFVDYPMFTFELTEVYRQKDPIFIEILNGIRTGSINPELLDKLNEQYVSELDKRAFDDYVTLTTHNPLVKAINEQKLLDLAGEVHSFQATVNGDFSKDAFPAEEELVLKVDAMVMFIKNDTSGKKQFYNGRTAKVKNLSNNRIIVTFLDEDTDLEVNQEIWQNVKYSLTEGENKVAENSAGSFTQFPLRLAWAITIHKSQGLTFDKAIVDVNSAFAHGQTYVALSRCRTLDGLILKEKVKRPNIITDPLVAEFMAKAQANWPDRQDFEEIVLRFEYEVLEDLFDFKVLSDTWGQFKSVFTVEDGSINAAEQIKKMNIVLSEKVKKVADRFKELELKNTTRNNPWVAANEMNSRLANACDYFLPYLVEFNDALITLHNVAPGSQADEHYYAVLNQLLEYLKMKISSFKSVPSAGSAKVILSSMRNAGLEYEPIAKWNTASIKIEKEIVNKPLYEQLLKFRSDLSKKKNLQDYAIVSEKTLQEIAIKLPRSLKQLSVIKNFGEGKTADFGEDLLKIIRLYLGESDLFS